MDFYNIMENEDKKTGLHIYPDFQAIRSKDLMIRGGAFYAIYDEESGLWSTDEYSAVDIIDKDLYKYRDKLLEKKPYLKSVGVKTMRSFGSNSYNNFVKYTKTVSDNYRMLDENLCFANTKVERESYVSKRLPYALEEGPIDAWDEIIGTLYHPDERAKLEWAIGSIVSGDSKKIQKFMVLYGDPGSGKGTILSIIQDLFQGYYTTFNAKALGSNGSQFATEAFKSNPLVAIQQDGDLSRIEDNTRLNSIISHEEMMLNEKYKSAYTGKMKAFLFMGTNKPVKITDSRSGIIRRLIDVNPSGDTIPEKHYHVLIDRVKFELGAIAHHCLQVYRSMGKAYYSGYRPVSMMEKTDGFYNFVEENYFLFKEQDGTTLKQAYDIYKEWCDEASMPYKMKKYVFKEELRSYFYEYKADTTIDGGRVRNWFGGFKTEKFNKVFETVEEQHAIPLTLDQEVSLLDHILVDQPAQYTNPDGNPYYAWDNVRTKLSDINTNKLHFVRLPLNHIVIDFDLKDEDGNKNFELNAEAASKFPPTYAEVSKGGEGIHLHYYYEGDPLQLERIYSKDIEIKVFNGKSALRRRLSRCNNIPITTIKDGLPIKEDKVVNFDGVQSETRMRRTIEKALRKEVHAGTKSNIDFIFMILDDANKAGVKYDLTDMSHDVLTFATNSSNQAEYCMKKVMEMPFRSDEPPISIDGMDLESLTFYDVEVFPNLFLIVFKHLDDDTYHTLINPSPQEVEQLMNMKLIGFNCRRYDNHMIYARYIGYNNEQLYQLSKAIIGNQKRSTFGQAYGLSHVDIYEYATKKQSLKKWEIELGINHHEMQAKWEIPEGMEVWDVPVPEEYWEEVAIYCRNDVMATEAVFKATESDYTARLILKELSGLSTNDTTQKHAARIIFGEDRNPQSKFVYTDLSEEFPGYEFERGKSSYRGEDPSEGGYVYAEPGVYGNVGLFDVASEHPTSAVVMNVFGPYTQNYKGLMDSRLAIKHDDIELGKFRLAELLSRSRKIPLDEARALIDEVLDKFDLDSDALSYALKIVINIVYGMTSAKFENPFKDPRNIDNIVAKRGALFMMELKYAVQEKGYTVVHIKTDSIKVADYDEEIKEFIFEFGRKFGYTFEHEATYDKMCLVNKAVYIAKVGWAMKKKKIGKWEAVGAQFAHPYTYKYLFSKENIEFNDYCEAKEVKTTMYMDLNESLWDEHAESLEKEYNKLGAAIRKAHRTDAGEKGYMSPLELKAAETKYLELEEEIAKYHDYHFVGKVGNFVPIKPGLGGGTLVRKSDSGFGAVGGTKDFRWLESDSVKDLDYVAYIDMRYFNILAEKAIASIAAYCDFDWFVSDQPYDKENHGILPF